MRKHIVNTNAAPKAIGPYSQAVVAGELVYTSGQIAIDPTNGEVEHDNVGVQTRRVLGNLGEVLNAAGASLQTVIKTTVYLTSMSDFAEMNNVYGEYFGENPPARACVEVSALPKNVLVEIEAVAYKTDSNSY